MDEIDASLANYFSHLVPSKLVCWARISKRGVGHSLRRDMERSDVCIRIQLGREAIFKHSNGAGVRQQQVAVPRKGADVSV